MPLVITRSNVLSLVTCNSQSGMMKSTLDWFLGFKVTKNNFFFLDRLNKLLGDVVISQGGVVPFINPEVSCHIECTSPLTNRFLAAPAQQNAKGQEGESGGLNTLSLYHYCITIRALYPILLVRFVPWVCSGR
jgi:hypothetical protein